MKYKEYSKGRRFLGKLDYESDIISEIEKFAANQDIKTAYVNVIGALKKVKLGFYDQDKREYKDLNFEKPLEIVQCNGNLTQKDDKPKAHLHITLGDEEGGTISGHLMEGSVVFAGEVLFDELRGEELVRGYDEVTGLPLWDFEL